MNRPGGDGPGPMQKQARVKGSSCEHRGWRRGVLLKRGKMKLPCGRDGKKDMQVCLEQDKNRGQAASHKKGRFTNPLHVVRCNQMQRSDPGA